MLKEYTVHYMRLVNGEKIAYRKAGTQGPNLLLIHGNMSSSIHFDTLMEALEDRYQIYAVDLRGFGDSTYKHPISSLQDFALDIKEIIDRLDLKDLTVLGWSTGGGIALELAVDASDRVKKVILLESVGIKGYPMFKKDENGQPILTERLWRREDIAKDPVQVAPALAALEKQDADYFRYIWDLTIYNLNKPAPERYERYLKAILQQRNLVDVDYALVHFNMTNEHNGVAEGSGRLEQLQADVLIIQGEQDLIVPKAFGLEMKQYLGDRGELKLLENCGHSPITDDLQEVIYHIDEFMGMNRVIIDPNEVVVGVVGTGIYIPEGRMTAKEIADQTNGIWEEWAIKEKLGIIEKPIPGEDDGTQEMAVKAALNCLENTGIDAKDIDVILSIGEEWKEYPLTTSALYVQDRIGATNAWGIDLQNRCCTTVSAMKIAKDMLLSDDEIDTIMIVGGYRNGDFVDYSDRHMSMMYNLSAGAGAIILKKNYRRNILLGSHIIADGSLSRAAGVEIGGICNPITKDNVEEAYKSLRLMDPVNMKNRLNEVSLNNWYTCIDEALRKSKMRRKDIDYLAILHFKRSQHLAMLKELGLTEEQTIYLEKYGHMGQIDQILSLHLALQEGKVKDGSVVCMIAAGIGYVWAANIIKWGEA